MTQFNNGCNAVFTCSNGGVNALAVVILSPYQGHIVLMAELRSTFCGLELLLATVAVQLDCIITL